MENRSDALKEYEFAFLHYYSEKYNVTFIKVENNNNCSVPTKVTLYTKNKRAISHKPTYFGVTLNNMFSWLKSNKIYLIEEIINRKGSDID